VKRAALGADTKLFSPLLLDLPGASRAQSGQAPRSEVLSTIRSALRGLMIPFITALLEARFDDGQAAVCERLQQPPNANAGLLKHQ